MALQTLPLLIMPPKSVQLCMKNHLNIKKLPLWARDGDWINLCKTVVEQSEILIVLQSQIITVVWAFSQNFGKKKLKKIVWSVNSHNIAKIVDFPRKETTYLIYFGCFVGLSNGTVKFCFVRDHSYYYVKHVFRISNSNLNFANFVAALIFCCCLKIMWKRLLWL